MKDKLRFLALGIFLSALILAGYTAMAEQVSKPSAEEIDSSEALGYKQKYESLLAEYELYKSVQESSPDVIESGADESDDVAAESSEPVGNVSSELDTFVFVVQEGQPSAEVIQNLQTAGLIDDIKAAENYLDQNDLVTKIQFGSYPLSKDMGYEVIFDIITVH